MAQKHTLEELNNCSCEELITIVLMMQGQLDALNDNIEKLIEQVRIANNYRFGRHTESLKSIEGQLSFLTKRTPPMMNLPGSLLLKRSLLPSVQRKRTAEYRPERFPGRNTSAIQCF